MVRSIGDYDRGVKLPSMHEMRTWILKEEVKTTSAIVDEIKATWKHMRVSLLSDGWSDMRNKSLINFLVNNQYGIVFLKTMDASDVVKNAQKLFELLDEVVEEIREEHIVHVITDNAATYKVAGRLLMEKMTSLYWTPCAAHCINLMLEQIGELPQHKNALLKAKRASVVYSIKTTKPLVNVLRVVDAERAPVMGFIYAAMDEAKEKIAKNLNDEVGAYKEIWNIIDDKWEKQLHCDLTQLLII
ncbi:uncharacterized protein LOC130998677 [Salvia miltiorrhiza]|uniref:uncharacterized protein LOC130998677 n=1 Tax=Salvia miltiorrhiza TaxID=226208 RepID=UPI0025AB8738|nr:uncharacterized protein LOC130998677 [Salvia miltiorrhiza]